MADLQPERALLAVTELSVHFGGVRAVNEVSLALGRAEILGVVGPNGSGKSTLLNVLTGVVAASHGSACLEGVPLPLGKPRLIRRLGLLRTFQTPQVVPELSCVENTLLSSPSASETSLIAWSLFRRLKMVRREEAEYGSALDALQTVGLESLADRPAGMLAYGQRRMLELARVINGRPSVVMLDEPSAGLNATETEQLAVLLKMLQGQGVSLLLVDHKIDFINRMCDRIVVFELGALIAEGLPEAVWKTPGVMAAYLGRRRDA
jgi:branched-chain amino acid transport system ATP-binding protein